MKKFLSILIIPLIGFVLGVMAFVGWYTFLHPVHVDVKNYPPAKANAYQNGREQAEVDLAKGKLKLKYFRMPVKLTSDEAVKHLREEYGIEVDEGETYGLTEGFNEYYDGYNDRMTTEIEKRFGKSVLDRVAQQVEVEWIKKHKERRR